MQFNIRYLVIAATLAGAAALSSCDLEEYPYGFYSDSNFYKTAEDAEAAVCYIYEAMTYANFSTSFVFLGDLNTDDMYPKGDAEPGRLHLDRWEVQNFKTNKSLGDFFRYCYVIVNRANSVIANVPGMDIKEELKNRYLGEAYFMRGYIYFYLARNFGLVPLHTEPVQKISQTAKAPAQSLDEVWEQVLGDLDEAAGLLPYYASAETGRADKVAAYGFLAKAYLHLASAKASGTPRYKDMTFDTDNYYAQAVEYAGKVVDDPEQAVFGFSANLLDIYDVEKPDGPEHIFILSHDRSGTAEGQYSKTSKYYIPYISGATLYLRQGNSTALIPTHEGFGEYRTASKDSGTEGKYATQNSVYDIYPAGDYRKSWLFVSEVYDKDGAPVGSLADKKLPYPFCRKFIDPKFIGDKTSTRPMLLRYSDVALVYAEAAGPTDKAYELVNYIRNRANLADLPESLNLADFRDAVIKERHYELAFEGNYAYDLRRLNRMHIDITDAKTQNLTAEQMVFYPIPSIETDLNPNYN